MQGVVLFCVTFLLGYVICRVDWKFQESIDVEEFQIPSDDDNYIDYVIEDSEADDDMAVTARTTTKVLSVKNGGPWGHWGKISFCPRDSFAVGYNMKIDEKGVRDNTALNAIKLICADEKGIVKGDITSTEGRWGSWVEKIKCAGSGYLSAFDLQVQKDMGTFMEVTGANYVKFKCRYRHGGTYELVIPPGHGHCGTWGAWSASCPKGSEICGIQTKVEKYQHMFYHHTSLNDVKFYCCELPN